jgi:tripartite-type tricarboxylate transporter receptor subunit TctC
MDPKLRDKLASDVRQVLQSANIRSQFAALGAEPGSMTQAQFASFVDAELTKWVKVISDANVKID